MKLKSLRVYRYALPLDPPLFLGGAMHTERVGLIAHVESDGGAEGYGEAAPLPAYSKETASAARDQLLQLGEMLTGPTADYPEYGDWRKLLGGNWPSIYPSVLFGLSAACLGAESAAEGAAPTARIGGDPAATVRISALLVGNAGEMVAQAPGRVEQGYRALKLKVGRGDPADEANMVANIRGAVPENIELRLDANRAWTLETAIDFGVDVAQCGVAYIEEPTQDPKDAAAFTQATGVPHALDETLHGATAAGRTLWEDAAALVLKPTLSALVRLWQADPLDVFPAEAPLVISSSFESGLGLSVLTVLASNPRLRQPAGLDTFRWLAADVLDPPFAPEMGALRPAHSPSRLRWDLLHEVGRV